MISPAPILRRRDARAFTLLEIMLASMGAALVMAALYGIFIHAIRLRDSATNRVRDARQRVRAESTIRTDLQNALISGGVIAATLQGGTNDNGGPGGSSLPGYLKFTTTTGRDTGADLHGDVQQVEYYLAHDPDAPVTASDKNSNMLVRAVTRDLLASAPATVREEQILHGVRSLAVEFYDGSTWQESWSYDGAAAALSSGNDAAAGTVIALGNTTLPDAVRVAVQLASTTPEGHAPPPVEVLVPWTTQPFAGATPSAATGSAAASASPTPGASATPGQNAGPDGEPPRGGPGPGSGPPPEGPPPGPPPGDPPSSGPPPRR